MKLAGYQYDSLKKCDMSFKFQIIHEPKVEHFVNKLAFIALVS